MTFEIIVYSAVAAYIVLGVLGIKLMCRVIDAQFEHNRNGGKEAE